MDSTMGRGATASVLASPRALGVRRYGCPMPPKRTSECYRLILEAGSLIDTLRNHIHASV
jgi:hypothetical protein